MKNLSPVVRPDGVRTACAHVRVSTDEQAKHKTSIDTQIAVVRGWCDKAGVCLVDVFSEPGLSGSDEGRPEFNAMVDWAIGPDRPYDMMVVRNLAPQAVSHNRLRAVGVEQVSVTETFGKDSAGNLMRSMVSAFNEHFGAEPPST